jgi:hypothetical protein
MNVPLASASQRGGFEAIWLATESKLTCPVARLSLGARANGEDPRFDPLVAAATAVLCVSEGRLLRER